MAKKTFNVSVDVSNNDALTFSLNNEIVSVSISGGNQTKYLASKGYRFDYGGNAHTVEFSTEIGGEYAFDGSAKGSVVAAFDASGAKDLIKLNATGLDKLTTIKTGAGNDSIVAVNNQSIIKTGEGNDIVTFSASVVGTGAASVTLGDGKDTLCVTEGAVEVKDYSFAEGDEISIGGITFNDCAAKIKVAADGKFSVGSTDVSVTGSLKSEGNVAEMKIDGNHYAFATGNVSDYVAKDKVLFKVVADDVDVLNFTSGKKDTSVLATGLAKDATLNFVSDHGNDSVAVVGTTKINYAITKNSGYDTFTGKTFTTDDTLMIKDGVAASLKMSGDVLTYGNTSVTGVLAGANSGSFKVQNAGSDESYLMSYADAASDTATFSTDAKFYLAEDKSNATVDASDLTDANINMNGDAVTYAAFSDGFNNIKTAQSGYVVGRNNVATSIDASAGVGRLDIYGGAKGNDSINLTNNNSTDVIYYSLGDGNDTVTGFDATSDVVFFYNANANYKALSEVVKFDAAGTTVTFDKKTNALTLQGVKAGDTLVFADQNMAEAMKVAIGKDNAVEFATDTKVYTNAETLKVNTGNTGDVIGVNLTAQSDDYGYYSTDIVNIDASGSNATTYLVGANKAGAKVIGGTGTNYIYGGGNKNQELFGNAAAVDVIYFGTGDGKDNVTSISADDGVLLYNVADINSVKVTADSSQTVVSLGSDKLTLNGLTETDLATFTFADQSGALYNYNTTDKKFVKKA